MRIALIFLLFFVPLSHAFACTEYPDKGVDVSNLPPPVEAHGNFTISLSAFSMLPPRKSDGASCSGSGIRLYLLTEDPKVTYDGYLMMKLIDGNLSPSFKKRIQNATKIKDNSGSFSFIPKINEWNDAVDARFQVQYIDRTGRRSEWSEDYDLGYTGGDRWFLKRYFEPELKSTVHSDLVTTATTIVDLLFEVDKREYADEKKATQISNEVGDTLSKLWNTLDRQAQTYTQSGISNLSLFQTYPVYRDFRLSSFRYYYKLLAQSDKPEFKSELIEAFARFKKEWGTCLHIAYVPHPRYTNKDRISCQ